jgi:orotidine-5'-phosphate decarboxylase
VGAAAAAGVELLTIHVSGGPAMMEAAARAAADEAAGPRLVGVTVLTSLSGDELGRTWGRSVPSVEAEVVRLAELAVASGLDGVVASAREAAAIRRAVGEAPLIVTPGIRLAGGEHHDQARVTGPAQAARLGADVLVVGRAVTAAPDPRAALEAVHRELAAPGEP